MLLAHIATALGPQTLAAGETLVTSGTLTGEGESGTFASWETADRERDDERLGVRVERTLRIGDHVWLENASGNVRELHGVLYRHARTQQLIDSAAFTREPDRVRYAGETTVGGRAAFELDVTAQGGDPESVWFDSATALPVREAYLDGDGLTTVELSDWRNVAGRLVAMRSVVSDGDHACDLVQTITDVQTNVAVDADTFAPRASRTLEAETPQTIPLIEREGHYLCVATVDGRPFTFLIDSGAQNVLIDSHVARVLHLAESGAMEIRGMRRSGGLHSVRIARLGIGEAHLDDVVASSIDIRASLGTSLKIDGILGYPFFASSLVKLDFAHDVMVVGAPASFAPQGTRLGIDVDRELAEGNVGLGAAGAAPFIVDTGSSDDVMLFGGFVDRHPGLVPFTGVQSSSFGFGGAAQTYRTQLDALTFAGYPLYHRATDVVLAPNGAFADRFDAGDIGLGVLRNFVVTFDFPEDALFVDRGAAFDDGRNRLSAMP